MEKMTQAQALAIAIEEVKNEEAKSKLAEMLAAIEAKRTKEDEKRAERKAENALLAEQIREFLAEQSDPVGVKVLAERFVISPQRVASLVRTIEGIEKGKADGKVTYKLG